VLRVKRHKPIFILIGNQSDKIFEREVSTDEGLALARTFGCSFMEASSKTAHNVELLFTNLIRALRSTGEMVTGGELSPQRSLKEKTHKKCCIF
jgi:GTPase KRas protein